MGRLVILGAHTAVGRALAEALEDRGLEAELVKATTTDRLEPDLDLVEASVLQGADVLFLAGRDDLATKLAAGAHRLRALVVDLAGVVDEAPLVFPALDSVDARNLRGAVRVPVGLVASVVALLRSLVPFGPRAARVVTLEGAAALGNPGIEELSRQTRAVFTGRDEASDVFYAPFAFGVLASVSGEEDPFGPDDAFAADVEAGLFGRAIDLRVCRMRVPVFTAEGAWVEVELDDPPVFDVLIDVLSDARGVHLAGGKAPSTLETVDRSDALIGRVRLQDRRLDLFVAADRLRSGATVSAALLAERVLS